MFNEIHCCDALTYNFNLKYISYSTLRLYGKEINTVKPELFLNLNK